MAQAVGVQVPPIAPSFIDVAYRQVRYFSRKYLIYNLFKISIDTSIKYPYNMRSRLMRGGAVW